jgi:vacuolar-type H+-ATPase subunit I/STV1
VTGVIARSRMQTFERVLWRSLRGNLFMKSAEIDEAIVDPDTDSVVDKNVFCIFAHGNEIIAKIKKISESLGGTLYSIDDSADKRRDSLLEVTSRIEDLNNVSLLNNQVVILETKYFYRFYLLQTKLVVLNYSKSLKMSPLGLRLFVRKRLYTIL